MTRTESLSNGHRLASGMLAVLLCAGVALAQPGAPAAIYDPAKNHSRPNTHGGAGELVYQTLLGADALPATNLRFFQQGYLPAGASIGEHFHYDAEEMFVILDGDAQFTINGRTAVVKGPALVPVRMGGARAVYNPSDKPMSWLGRRLISAEPQAH